MCDNFSRQSVVKRKDILDKFLFCRIDGSLYSKYMLFEQLPIFYTDPASSVHEVRRYLRMRRSNQTSRPGGYALY